MYQYENLPRKTEFRPFQNSDWKMPETEPQLQSLMSRMKQILDNKFLMWEKDPQFKFVFPPSAFTLIDKPLIAYHQPGTINDNQEVQPLSQKQISQIKQSGTFFVESNFYSIPYKWKLNSWIYKGYSNRIQTFYKDLSLVFNQLYQVPQRFTSDLISVKKGAIRLVKFFPNVINVVIGMRKMHDKFPEYVRMIEKERSVESLKVCSRTKLYEYLYVPLLPIGVILPEQHAKWLQLDAQFNKRLTKLNQIDMMFNKRWSQKKRLIIKKLKEQFEDQKIINIQCLKEMKRIRQDIIKELSSEIPAAVLEDLLYFIAVYDIVKTNQNKIPQDVEAARKQYQQMIDKNYKVKKYCEQWRYDFVEEHLTQQRQKITQQAIEKTEAQLKDPVFTKYCEIIPDNQRLEQIKRQHPPQKIPNRQFQCTYKLFPPYEVQAVPNAPHTTFILVKEKDIIVSTNYPGWKVVLYFIRWYTWTRNVMYWLFRGLWGGRLGLKVLFYLRPFNPRYAVNAETGELTRSKQIEWKPIIYQFCQTWSDIKKDRREFEQAPDNGFFGKTCGRICSLFYNYIIRMIFYMFFWLILIKPLVIIFNVIILTLISTTAILWIPIILVLYGMFNMLIYNFDLDEHHHSGGRFSERFFPFISMSIKFVYDLFYTLVAFMGIIYHPLAAFILLIWALLRLTTKTIVDFMMLGFIKCCGRSPVRDTKIAWRVSGPGLSRDYYQTIKEQDVYILVLAEIQKFHLQYLREKYKKDIRALQKYPSEIMSNILKPFSVYFNSSTGFSELNNSVNYYIEKLDNHYNRQIQKYPTKPGSNIRFSQRELEVYLSKSYEILINYIKKYGSQFLYDQLKVDKDEDSEHLIYKLWMSIFNNQEIFEPFEDLDHRFELVNDREDDAIRSVLKTISGDPEYKQKLVSLKFLNKIRIEDNQLISVGEVLGTMMRYRQREYGDSKQNICEGLFFNYNVRDEVREPTRVFEMTMDEEHPMV